MPLTEPTRLVLAKTYVGVDDPDAADYIARVEAADEAASPGVGALETATKVAIHSFVKGCKADGIWPAIKASCILAGARTLAGALVPLKGDAPTNFNFTSSDYDRKTGLTGNGTNAYLDSNFNALSVALDDIHVSAFVTPGLINTSILGDRLLAGFTGIRSFRSNGNQYYVFSNRNTTESHVNIGPNFNAMFIGSSRSSSSEFTRRADGTDTIALINSGSLAIAQSFFVFASRKNSTGAPQAFTDGTISFYSFGQALPSSPTQSGLELLDARVTDLINAFGAAIP